VSSFIQSLSAIIRTDIILGLLSAVILAICGNVFTWLYFRFRNRASYSIFGFWISEYNSAFNKEVSATDLLYIKPYRNKIIAKYQQYDSKLDEKSTIWRGEGYVGDRSNRVAIAYFFDNESAYQTGIMLLTQIDLKSTQKGLSGKSYELDSRSGDGVRGQSIYGSKLNIYYLDYVAYRPKLSFKQKFLFHLNMKALRSYNDAKQILDIAKG